jgi:hypothetical protein
VWAYATRELSGFTGTPRTNLLGEDATFEAGVGARKVKIDNVDVAISTRSSHVAADIWTVAARTITALTGQPRTDLMGENADFEAGTGTRKARIDASIASRSSHAAADVWAVAARKLTGFDGTPRSDLLGEDATFEAGSGTRKARIDRLANIPAFETPVEASIVMDGTEKTLVEKTDNKVGILDGYVDLTPMAAGDTIVVRQSMQVKAAGAYAKYAEETYSGAQTIPLLHIVTKTAKDKIKVTAQQTAIGTYRTLDVQFYRRLQA